MGCQVSQAPSAIDGLSKAIDIPPTANACHHLRHPGEGRDPVAFVAHQRPL